MSKTRKLILVADIVGYSRLAGAGARQGAAQRSH